MGFKENLLQKIEINHLAMDVQQTIGSPDSGKRLDRDLMRQLLDKTNLTYQRERDLDLYLDTNDEGPPLILVLDNELKIYRTSIEDVALLKSPTIKEMVSIRNAIKILNDKDVVISRKNETVERVRAQLIDNLDLSYTDDDIKSLAQDGRDALENNYADGVVETLTLFAELLGYVKAPKPFQLAHHLVLGRTNKTASGEIECGPLVAFNMMQSKLIMCREPINGRDKAAIASLEEAAGKSGRADLEGVEVWEALKEAVFNLPTPENITFQIES